MKPTVSIHPFIMLIYFIGVLLITMFTVNPVLISLSYFSSIVFCGMLIGSTKLFKSLSISIPIMILGALTNPIFVHMGETYLFFLNGNPVTLESVIYGVFISMMLMSVFYWFKCYNYIMTSDKFVYLFGKIIPKVGLIISMTLRFVPKMTKQYKRIDDTQKAMGIYSSESITDRLRGKFRVLRILLTWSLENSIETADSMRARGYGLKGRSNYANYPWTNRDTLSLIIVSLLTVFNIILLFIGIADYDYYPSLDKINLQLISSLMYVSVFLLMMSFTVLEIKEKFLWHYLKSTI